MNIKRLTLSLALSLLLIATAVLLPIPAKVNADGIDTDIISPVITDIRILNTTILRPGVVNVEVDVVENETPVTIGVTFRQYNGETYGSYVDGSFSGGYTGTHTIRVAISSNYPIGEYVLSSISVRDKNNSSYYSLSEGNLPGGEKSILVVDEFDYVGAFNLDAPGLTQGLKDMEVGKAMRVYSNSSAHTLKEEHLDAIKGQDKIIVINDAAMVSQWVIKGTNITGETKDIDVGIRIANFYKGQYMWEETTWTWTPEYDEDGNFDFWDEVEDVIFHYAPENLVVITFASNGQLPGKMQVRFKADALIPGLPGAGEIEGYKYYVTGNALTYEGETDDMVFDGTDKWCHMTITHNSTFVASNSNKLNGIKWGSSGNTKPPATKKKAFTLKLNLDKGKVTKKINVWGRTIKKGAKKISAIKKTYTYITDIYIGKLPTLTRKGYKFLGWYVRSKKVTAKTKVSKTITTLKAKWKKNKKKGK